jgi:hypothetical protein
VDDVEDALGDGGVELVDDAVVNLAPFSITRRHGRRNGDMGV